MPEEKRQHERVTAHRILVRVPAIDQLRGQYVKDLSTGGLFIKTDNPVPAGAEVSIELLALGSDTPLKLRGKVTRVDADDAAKEAGTAGVGIQLDALSPEAEQRLTALLAECRHPTPRGPEADDLVTLVQSMLFEQGVLQDALAEKDRELSEHTRALAAASPGGAEATALRQQISNLTSELAAARERGTRLQRELTERDDDEATSRTLAARLVGEKAALERRLQEETERGKADRERVAKELVELERELGVQVETKAHLESAIEELEGHRERAEFTARAATTQIESVTEKLRGQLEESEKRAKALEAALAASDVERSALAADKARLDEALLLERAGRGEAEAKAKANDRLAHEWAATLAAEKAARAEAERGLDALIDQQRGAAAQLEAAKARTERLEADLAEAVGQTERARAREREVRRLLALMTPETGAAPSPDAAAEWDQAATSPGIAVAEAAAAAAKAEAPKPAEAPAAAEPPPLPPAVLLEFAEFSQRLRSGGRVVRGAAFSPPVDPVEVAVSNHLDTQDSVDGIVRASKGRYSRERIAQVLFVLY
ncbi:MAG: PilZ domain-containing protein, partial [Myxococcaceae bacterium]